MCDIIQTTCLLANVLQKRKGEISFYVLRQIRHRIERKFPDVVVDLSYFSVASAIENYPQMFRWDHNRVKRAERSERLYASSFIERQFNSRLPPTVRNRVHELV